MYKRRFLTIFFFVFAAISSEGLRAQNVDSLAIKYHLSELPNFNYGTGFGIISPDSAFRFNIRFRMQTRLLLSTNKSEITRAVARIRRLRLKFNGWVYTPKLSYAMELGFSPSDVSTLPGSPPNIVLDAIILYKINPKVSIGFGQTKLPGNRQRVVSSGNLNLIDRSISNAIFNIDRDFGFFIYYTNRFGKNFFYLLKGAVTTGEGRNWTHNTSDGFSYTGRIELLPLGKFTNKGDYFEGDLEREPTPKLAIGLTYNFNDDAVRTAGQRGLEMWDTKSLENFMADLIFKYNGLYFEAEYLMRKTKNPISTNPDNPDEQLFVYKGSGMNLQVAHMLPKNFEIAGRYSFTRPDDEIEQLAQKFDNVILGLNKYIRGHTLKLQADFGYYISEEMASGEKSESFNFRFQIELGI